LQIKKKSQLTKKRCRVTVLNKETPPSNRFTHANQQIKNTINFNIESSQDPGRSPLLANQRINNSVNKVQHFGPSPV